MFVSNNLFYSVFNALFPKCVAHKEKSWVYFIALPYKFIHYRDQIGSQLPYFLQQLI